MDLGWRVKPNPSISLVLREGGGRILSRVVSWLWNDYNIDSN